MKKRNFNRSNAEKVYNYMLKYPPINKGGSQRRGNALNNEFWDGYNRVKTPRQPPTSLAEAAYWAGQDYKIK